MELVLGIFLLLFLVGYFLSECSTMALFVLFETSFIMTLMFLSVESFLSLSLFLSLLFLFFFLLSFSSQQLYSFCALGLFALFGFFYNQLSSSEQTDCAC